MTEEQIMNILNAVGAAIIVGGGLSVALVLIGARLLLGKGWFSTFKKDMRHVFNRENKNVD